MTRAQEDFRAAFARMAAEAIISRFEVASLLATTPGAVTQMAYRGELPPTAFPTKRRACWFVGDIRRWLINAAEERARVTSQEVKESAPAPTRIGRPRLPSGVRQGGK